MRTTTLIILLLASHGNLLEHFKIMCLETLDMFNESTLLGPLCSRTSPGFVFVLNKKFINKVYEYKQKTLLTKEVGRMGGIYRVAQK